LISSIIIAAASDLNTRGIGIGLLGGGVGFLAGGIVMYFTATKRIVVRNAYAAPVYPAK
jgi:hypothetical protein